MLAERVICETPRLVLRRLTIADLGIMAELNADPEVSRFIGGVRTLDQTRERLCEMIEQYERYGFGKWGVELRGTDELIGRCGPSVVEIDGVYEVELGYTFGRAHWGKGYATEAAAAAMQYSFDVLGQRRLISLIDRGNLASARVALKNGMTYERTSEWQGADVDVYSIHRES